MVVRCCIVLPTLLVTVVLCNVAAVYAANNTFSPVTGDYATPSNWSLGTIPGNGNNDEPQIGVNLSPRRPPTTPPPLIPPPTGFSSDWVRAMAH